MQIRIRREADADDIAAELIGFGARKTAHLKTLPFLDETQLVVLPGMGYQHASSVQKTDQLHKIALLVGRKILQLKRIADGNLDRLKILDLLDRPGFPDWLGRGRGARPLSVDNFIPAVAKQPVLTKTFELPLRFDQRSLAQQQPSEFIVYRPYQWPTDLYFVQLDWLQFILHCLLDPSLTHAPARAQPART